MQAECTPSNGQDHAELFRRLADAVQEHLHSQVDADTVRQIVGEEVAKAKLPRAIEVHLPDGRTSKVEGPAHFQLAEMIALVEEGHTNILLVGPAGSGKTTLAKGLAQALGLPFAFLSLSGGVTETHILGRTLPDADGAWRFKTGKFVDIYETGGVFLLDEVDAADSNVMVAINAALANGVLVTTDGIIHHRHKDCYILAAANTWGRGGDQMYVGRNQLDAATLDRFILCTIFVSYDICLERSLAEGSLTSEQADELLNWVGELRESIKAHRLRRVASTRLVVNAIKALAKGRTMGKVKERYFQDWSTDEKAKVAQ